MANRLVFSAEQYKIRQRGKKYYVYKAEKVDGSNIKETYIGPLVKTIES
ncbi:putative integrase [Stygiolobus azoricus]|nr:putative integrase [Stygiolobus azoricus]